MMMLLINLRCLLLISLSVWAEKKLHPKGQRECLNGNDCDPPYMLCCFGLCIKCPNRQYFDGPQCKFNQTMCDIKRCKGNGRCGDPCRKTDADHCICDPGFAGRHCDETHTTQSKLLTTMTESLGKNTEYSTTAESMMPAITEGRGNNTNYNLASEEMMPTITEEVMDLDKGSTSASNIRMSTTTEGIGKNMEYGFTTVSMLTPTTKAEMLEDGIVQDTTPASNLLLLSTTNGIRKSTAHSSTTQSMSPTKTETTMQNSKTVNMPSTNGRPTASTHITNKPVCKSRVFKDMSWPETEAGKLAEVNCPLNTVGTATWKCDALSLTFVPDHPNMAKCRSSWWDDFQGGLPVHLDNTHRVGDIVRTTEILANKTKDRLVVGGDILKAIELTKKVKEKFQSLTQNDGRLQIKTMNNIGLPENLVGGGESFSGDEVRELMSSTATCFDNIFRANDAWEGLPRESQIEAAKEVISSVENLAQYYSCATGEDNSTFLKETFVIQTYAFGASDKIDQDLVFPSPSSSLERQSFLTMKQGIGFNNSNIRCRDELTGYGVLYQNASLYLTLNENKTLNSEILTFGLGMKHESVNLPEGNHVYLVFKHIKFISGRKPRCVFWKETNENNTEANNKSAVKWGEWSDSGCYVKDTNETHTICECNHLTNFALLMDVGEIMDNVDERHRNALNMLSIICCSFSLFAYSFTLVLLWRSKQSLQSWRITLTANVSATMITVNLLVLFGFDNTENKVLCSLFAAALLYSLLAAFFWMFLEGYNLYLRMVVVFNTRAHLRLRWMYLFAYGAPLIIVISTVASRPTSFLRKSACWLTAKNGVIWAFMAPVLAILLANCIILILALRVRSSVAGNKRKKEKKQSLKWMKGLFFLMCSLGITWITGTFYLDEKLISFAYVFVLFNAFQAVFIFIFYFILSEDSRMKKVLALHKNNSSSSTISSIN